MGYFVGFVFFEGGEFVGIWEVFVDGFVCVDMIINVMDVVFWLMGLVEGFDGFLYISDMEKGVIWWVSYIGL